MRAPLRYIAVCLLWACGIAGVCQADEIAVTSPEELESAFAIAAPGDSLRLAPGSYGKVMLRDGGGRAGQPVTIVSADPQNPARFQELSLYRVSHVDVDSLVLDYIFSPGDPAGIRPFQIVEVRHVKLRGLLIDGDTARGVDDESTGFPTGTGLWLRDSKGVSVQNSEIRRFLRGAITSRSDSVAFISNDIHSMRMDGMNFAQVTNIRIIGNHIHDFDRSPRSEDHADMIQFWTAKTKAPTRNVLICDNVLSSGNGLFTQSIFMRNEEVDRGRAGSEMYYRNVTIKNNLISNAHLHGITVGETSGLRILNNTVIRNAVSEGKELNPDLWRPQIRVAGMSQNVEILRNVMSKIVGFDGQKSWQLSDNVIVQNEARLEPGHYNAMFIGDPADPASLAYRPGGALDGVGIGAPRLER